MATDVVRRLIKHRWKMVAGFLLLGVIASAFFAYSQPKRFTAQSTLLVGGNDIPTALTSMVDQKRSGPLGADLPAVTQSAIIASAVIGDRVGKKLGMTAAATESMISNVSVKAQTDNLFAISADGPTAELAARRANTFGTEYLAYRAENGKALLNDLAATAKAKAKQESDQAAALDDDISAAIKAKNTNEIAPLRTQQGQLLDQALADGQDVSMLLSAAQNYSGGGSLSSPAVAADATVSPVVWRDVAFGALLGLLVGVIIGSVMEKLSDMVRTRADAAEAAGHPVWMAVSGHRSINMASLRDQAQVAALAIVYSTAAGGLEGGIVIRPVSSRTDAGPVAIALSETLNRLDRPSGLVVLGSRAAESDHGQHSGATSGVGMDTRAGRAADGADQPRALAGPPLQRSRTRMQPQANEWAGSPTVPPTSREDSRYPFVVTLSGPHFTTDSDLGDLPGGSAVLLVVTSARDRSAQVRRAARELELAGMRVRGVVLLRADPADATEDDAVPGTVDNQRVAVQHPS